MIDIMLLLALIGLFVVVYRKGVPRLNILLLCALFAVYIGRELTSVFIAMQWSSASGVDSVTNMLLRMGKLQTVMYNVKYAAYELLVFAVLSVLYIRRILGRQDLIRNSNE